MISMTIVVLALMWSISQMIWLIRAHLYSDSKVILGLFMGPFAFLLKYPTINLNTYISPELFARLKEDHETLQKRDEWK